MVANFLMPGEGMTLSRIILSAEKPQVITVTSMFIITFALVISGLLKQKKA